MEELHDAIVDLKALISKQNQLQEETLAVMRALIVALEEHTQVIADLHKQDSK